MNPAALRRRGSVRQRWAVMPSDSQPPGDSRQDCADIPDKQRKEEVILRGVLDLAAVNVTVNRRVSRLQMRQAPPLVDNQKVPCHAYSDRQPARHREKPEERHNVTFLAELDQCQSKHRWQRNDERKTAQHREHEHDERPHCWILSLKELHTTVTLVSTRPAPTFVISLRPGSI